MNRKTVVSVSSVCSSFIKERFIRLLWLVLSLGLSIGIFMLYDFPFEVLFYVYSCSLGIYIVFGALEFRRYYQRHVALLYYKEGVEVDYVNLLKEHSKSLIEQDYITIIQQLKEQTLHQKNEFMKMNTDMLNYYSMWAHQIKTPIAALRLILQSQDINSENKILIEESKEQLFKIEQYVEMVLQYLRMEDMSNDLLLQNYELDGIVKQAIKKYAAILIRQNITLEYNTIEETVLTDEKWLVFVIQQLLSNAVKYAKNRNTQVKPKIKIYLKEETTLVIEDNGIGIKEEDIPRVFEKGFTGYNGREDKKSTGIGLYLCNQVLKKLGHTMKMESTPGVGTKVFINLATQEELYE